MDFWLWMPLLFASGYLLGRWHNWRWRDGKMLRKLCRWRGGW